jgi:hypothetical protein
MILRNEFATVEITEDRTTAGPTLLIRDLEQGTEIRLDALELACLTRMSHEDFTDWVKPR